VALDAQGNIYAADSGNGRIEKLSSTGKPLGASARGRFQNPAAIAIGSQGGVFIVETGRDHILKIAFTR
jgi:DNA-binding beta-propeller fold protein YncE